MIVYLRSHRVNFSDGMDLDKNTSIDAALYLNTTQ